MGKSSSKSKTSQDVKNNIINKSSLNFLNENIVNTAVNVTIENVKSCSASLIQNQEFEVIGLNASGDISIVVDQVQQGMLTFECIQIDKVHNEIVNQIMNNVMNEIAKNVDTDVLNNLEALTKSKSTSDFLSLGKSNSDSKTEQNIKNTVVNTDQRNIKNVVKFSTELNFSNKNFSNCISSAIAQQSVKARNLTAGGNISFVVNQKQAIELFAKCVQSSDVANTITSSISSFYGLKINDDISTGLSNTAVGKTISEALVNGPLGSLGTMFANAFSPLTDLLSSLTGFGGQAAGALGAILCICVIIIIIICCCSSILGGAYSYFK